MPESTIVKLPTHDPILVSEYHWAASDSVAKKILKYLIEHGAAYFNQMSKDFITSDISTRNTLFGRLLRLEKAGILRADLVRINYGEENIQKWVKEYKISEVAKDWVKSISFSL